MRTRNKKFKSIMVLKRSKFAFDLILNSLNTIAYVEKVFKMIYKN